MTHSQVLWILHYRRRYEIVRQKCYLDIISLAIPASRWMSDSLCNKLTFWELPGMARPTSGWQEWPEISNSSPFHWGNLGVRALQGSDPLWRQTLSLVILIERRVCTASDADQEIISPEPTLGTQSTRKDLFLEGGFPVSTHHSA